MTDDERQKEAEELAEYMDRLEEKPSGRQITVSGTGDDEIVLKLGAQIPVRDPWTGRRLNWQIT